MTPTSNPLRAPKGSRSHTHVLSHSTAPARNHKNSDLRSEYETRELQSRLQPITELSQRKQGRGKEECGMWKLHKSHSMTAAVLPERMAKEHGRAHVCAVLNVQFQPSPLRKGARRAHCPDGFAPMRNTLCALSWGLIYRSYHLLRV
jgi:hypothetical protein